MLDHALTGARPARWFGATPRKVSEVGFAETGIFMSGKAVAIDTM